MPCCTALLMHALTKQPESLMPCCEAQGKSHGCQMSSPQSRELSSFDGGAEHILPAMQASTSCLLLGGLDFLNSHGAGLASMLSGLIGSVNDRGLLKVIPVLYLVLQLTPSGTRWVDSSWPACRPAWQLLWAYQIGMPGCRLPDEPQMLWSQGAPPHCSAASVLGRTEGLMACFSWHNLILTCMQR